MLRLKTLSVVFGASVGAILPTQAGASGDEPGFVAYVEKVYSTQNPVKPPPLSQVVKIVRNGHLAPATGDPTFLRLSDRLFVVDPNATVVVRMVASRERIPVRHHTDATGVADFEVKSAIPPLPMSAFHAFIAIVLPANQSQGAIGAGSRLIGACYNENGKTNDPVQFDVPVLTAEKSYLAAGNRSLFVSWRGGAPPFKVVLADAVTGVSLAEKEGIRDQCSTSLPFAQIASAGHYRLSVIDGNGVREEDDSILGASDVPALPNELKALSVDNSVRSLYFATWLTAKDGGVWTFEAQQRVAKMDCNAPAVQEWMGAVGRGAKCA